MEIDGDHDFALFNKHFSRCNHIDYMTSALVSHAMRQVYYRPIQTALQWFAIKEPNLLEEAMRALEMLRFVSRCRRSFERLSPAGSL